MGAPPHPLREQGYTLARLGRPVAEIAAACTVSIGTAQLWQHTALGTKPKLRPRAQQVAEARGEILEAPVEALPVLATPIAPLSPADQAVHAEVIAQMEADEAAGVLQKDARDATDIRPELVPLLSPEVAQKRQRQLAAKVKAHTMFAEGRSDNDVAAATGETSPQIAHWRRTWGRQRADWGARPPDPLPDRPIGSGADSTVALVPDRQVGHDLETRLAVLEGQNVAHRQRIEQLERLLHRRGDDGTQASDGAQRVPREGAVAPAVALAEMLRRLVREVLADGDEAGGRPAALPRGPRHPPHDSGTGGEGRGEADVGPG